MRACSPLATGSLALGLLLFSPRAQAAWGELHGALNWEGQEREYFLHLPMDRRPDSPVPLLIVMHGGGGKARRMPRFTEFSELSDREGFIAVYPQGIEESWNDGRENSPSQADDVGFLRALVLDLVARYPVDPKRVYATGISNGGMMSFRLGIELPELFAAVAPVDALLSVPLSSSPPPSRPVPILILLGDQDPMMPYEGGRVAPNLKKPRGRVISADATLEWWQHANRCVTQAVVDHLPDIDPEDGQRTRRERYVPEQGGAPIERVVVEGGGHTWPGGAQYLPVSIVGPTTHDFEASELIWAFLREHRMPE